jgi:hypothetical protein
VRSRNVVDNLSIILLRRQEEGGIRKKVRGTGLRRGSILGIDKTYRVRISGKWLITKAKILLIPTIFKEMSNNKNKMVDNKNN